MKKERTMVLSSLMKDAVKLNLTIENILTNFVTHF